MQLLPKEFFQIQLDFADMLFSRHDENIEDAYFKHTAFYARCIGLDDTKPKNPNHPLWKSILYDLTNSPDSRLDTIYRYYLDHEKNYQQKANSSSCFHVHYYKKLNKYKLHFSPIDPKGNLGSDRIDKRFKELKEMFQEIKKENNNTATLFLTTWLLQVAAFTRLFPPELTSNATQPRGNLQTSNATWGQFVDKDKNIKSDLVKKFENKYKNLNYSNYHQYFPLVCLYSELPLVVLYDYYD